MLFRSAIHEHLLTLSTDFPVVLNMANLPTRCHLHLSQLHSKFSEVEFVRLATMIVSDFGAAKGYLTLSTAVLSCGLFCVAFYLIDAIYSLFLGPLAKIPGPKSRALSYLPLSKGEWTGTNVQDALELHEQYGRVVRMGPKSVSFIGSPEIWYAAIMFNKKIGRAHV